MVDTLELKSAMVRNDLTLYKLASMVGLSKASLSYKVNNKREFTVTEVVKVARAMNLSNDEVHKIFFAK